MIVPLLVFAIALLAAALLSKAAHTTPLSTSLIFLIAGFLAGPSTLDLVQIRGQDDSIVAFVEVALFSVLFADGMRIGIRDLLRVWRLPGRALILGLPLTLIFMAVLARSVLGLGWPQSFLVAAVLSPTDPVFASGFVSQPEVPQRLRRLLNVESGLNDGLALPIVLLVLSVIGVEPLDIPKWTSELLIGIGVGIVIPWVILNIEQFKLFSVDRSYMPMFGLSIALLVYSVARLLNGNLFLAAFSAGITIASINPKMRKRFWEYAEPVSELLKLGAVLIFGALLSWKIFTVVGWQAYVYAIMVLFLARPAALGLALIASPLNWRERIAAAWFGPRGFASVVYGLLVLGSGVYRARDLFQLISLVIIASVVAHSTTDVLIGRWFAVGTSEPSNTNEGNQENEEDTLDD